MRKNKKSILVMMLVAMSLIVTGCGSTGNYSSDTIDIEYSDDIEYNSGFGSSYSNSISALESANHDFIMPEESKAEAVIDTEVVIEPEIPVVEEIKANTSEEKLVYTCSMSIESKDYAGSLLYVKNMISEYGGIIQSEDESDNAYMWYYDSFTKENGTQRITIECRVPSSKYFEFIAALNDINTEAKVVSKRSDVQNITQKYNDTNVQIEALKIQEDRLLQMLENAETIQDMLAIESRLTDVQTQLNLYTNKKSSMDLDVAYSYVSIKISEVVDYSKPVDDSTFFSRMKNVFFDVCDFTAELFEEVLTFIMYAIPVLILVGYPITVVIRVCIKLVKRYKEKHPAAPRKPIYRKTRQSADENRKPLNDKVLNTESEAPKDKGSKE